MSWNWNVKSGFANSSPPIAEMVSVIFYSNGDPDAYWMERGVAKGLRDDFRRWMGVMPGIKIDGGLYPCMADGEAREMVVQFRRVERIVFGLQLG